MTVQVGPEGYIFDSIGKIVLVISSQCSMIGCCYGRVDGCSRGQQEVGCDLHGLVLGFTLICSFVGVSRERDEGDVSEV